MIEQLKSLSMTEIRVGFFGGDGHKAQLPMIAQVNESVTLQPFMQTFINECRLA